MIKDEGNTGMEEISSMDGLVDKAADSQSFIKNHLSSRRRLALRNQIWLANSHLFIFLI